MTTHPEPPSEPSDDDSLPIPDEVWEKFSQDSFGAIHATAPKEPSARARMVAQRLQGLDAEAAEREAKRRLRAKREPAPHEPHGWQSERPWRETGEPRRREPHGWRDRLRTVLIAILAGGIATIAMDPSLLHL